MTWGDTAAAVEEQERLHALGLEWLAAAPPLLSRSQPSSFGPGAGPRCASYDTCMVHARRVIYGMRPVLLRPLGLLVRLRVFSVVLLVILVRGH